MATENEKCTPIELMAALLGDVTARAEKAERELKAAKHDAKDWFVRFTEKRTQCEMFEKAIDEKNEQIRMLQEALENAAHMVCPEGCPGKEREA